jgi:alkanesulfonate monooxygenase SsuD/methylene tetrahydromethanopterin reductase-like flavin-dependent oxidoreductase (luciferase family)
MKLSIFSVQDHYTDRSRTVPQLYGELAGQAELADRLGYEVFFCAEHHFHAYGVAPNPAVLLAAIAPRTRRLRLGTAIAALTFHDPQTVAENYAMLDALSGGRLVLGVGSGYLKHEFGGFGIDPVEKHERFAENLGLVKRLLAGERVTHRGRFATLDDVAINVLPVQEEVPIYVATLRKEGALQIGKRGQGLLAVPYASLDHFDELPGLIEEFHRGWAEAGAAPPPHGLGDNIFCFHTHVAETDAEAERIAAAPFDLYVATRLYAKKAVYVDIQRSGLGLFGSPETVADKLVALYRMGIEHVMTLHNFGLMPHVEVEKSMRLLMERVLPRVRDATRRGG